MRRSTQICSLIPALVSLGCAPGGPATLTEAERAAVADSLQAFATVIEEGVEALDVSRFAPVFSSDADLTWAADGQLMLISHDSLMSFYRVAYRGFREIDFTWDTLRVSVLSPDVGVLAGAGHFEVTDTAGSTSQQGVAVTYVFVRRNGRWQLLHGHASHRFLQ